MQHAVTTIDTDQWVGAGVSLGVAVVILWVVRRLFSAARARRVTQAVLRGELTPGVDTRLRLLERAVYALILIFGIASALSQFEGVRIIGRTLLTSGAIAAAILGFAARQTLANVVAGLMIAVSQPLRIGDWVAFEEHYGVVEDVTLSYTTLRTGSGRRVLVPNEKLASGVLVNDSLIDPPVAVSVDVWLAPDADADHAVATLCEATGRAVSVAEITATGIRLSVAGDAVSPTDRAAHEAELRADCLRRLRAEGLLPAI